MKLNNTFLFVIPALIWGSTYFVIKFQLGVVDPTLSVAYRFALASLILYIYSRMRGLSLKYNPREHFFFALQGLLLFGTNYWLIYMSEQFITSGLVAVGFSLLIFMNIFFNWLILKTPIKKSVLFGGLLGVCGTVLIFLPEFLSYEILDNTILGILLLIGGVTSASLGNIVSAYNQKINLPVVQTNIFGMLYGSIIMFSIAVFSGKEISFEMSSNYLISLIYLAVFGSVIAFSAFLTLIGRIGPDKAAYVLMLLPAVALTLSIIYENYRITPYALVGIVLILTGNYLALKSRKRNESKTELA